MSLLFLESEIDMPLKMTRLPVRCTVVKLPNALILISPIRFTTEQYKQIDALGEVTDIVAPSLIHNRFVADAMERYKSAKIWGSVGYREKCPHVRWDFFFGEAPWPYGEQLDAILLEGQPEIKEVVFFDRDSRTLIVADALFNLKRPAGWASPVILRLMGTYGRFACSRLFASKISDKTAMASSLKKVLAWPFERIAMGHGDLVLSEGRALAEAAFRERGLLP